MTILILLLLIFSPGFRRAFAEAVGCLIVLVLVAVIGGDIFIWELLH